MTESIKISVVIPNRNDSKYLALCINSVIRQSILPYELIILDDESTDNSVELIKSLIHGFSFAKLYINAKNIGATENSNLGLSLASGDYILFLGANDFILPGFFARAQDCLIKYKPGIWSSMVVQVDEEDNFIKLHPSPIISLNDSYFDPHKCRHMMSSIGNWMTGQTTIYHRESLLIAGGFDPTLKALTDLLAAQVVASRHGACFSPVPLGVMRIHKGAFLSETLSNIDSLNLILHDIETRGPKKEIKLFTTKMIYKTRLRFYFSSLRLSGGATLVNIKKEVGFTRGRMLLLCRFLPSSFPIILNIFFFIIMRPFDILNTLWYRIIKLQLLLLFKNHFSKSKFKNILIDFR